MKTKGKDRIRLPDGSETTLAEALDAGRLILREDRYYDPPRYFAVDPGWTVSWEVGKTLFLSRTKQPLPFSKK